jgi:hypothetical protein
MTLRAGKPPASARHRRHGEDDGRIYFDSSPLSCAVTANNRLSFFVASGTEDREHAPVVPYRTAFAQARSRAAGAAQQGGEEQRRQQKRGEWRPRSLPGRASPLAE